MTDTRAPRRSKEARKYVPGDLKLVELFGWTLGGLYLARYSNSPAGVFDELVVLGGLVWNAPTSCAWASRVYVDSKSARTHGVRTVGLPSRLASFSQGQELSAAPRSGMLQRVFGPPKLQPSWWNVEYAGHSGASSGAPVTVRNCERGALGMRSPVTTLVLPPAREGWAGPRIKLGLPSFSGNTATCPGLLQYTCKLTTNVRLRPSIRLMGDECYDTEHPEDVSTVLRGRPLLTMGFDNMHMLVHAPQPYLP